MTLSPELPEKRDSVSSGASISVNSVLRRFQTATLKFLDCVVPGWVMGFSVTMECLLVAVGTRAEVADGMMLARGSDDFRILGFQRGIER